MPGPKTTIPAGSAQKLNTNTVPLAVKQPTPQDFAPAFLTFAKTDHLKADAFAVSTVRSLTTHDQLALHFDQVARMDDADRLAVLAANREGGNGISVIHAASFLPAAQAQVLMQGFMAPNGEVGSSRA